MGNVSAQAMQLLRNICHIRANAFVILVAVVANGRAKDRSQRNRPCEHVGAASYS